LPAIHGDKLATGRDGDKDNNWRKPAGFWHSGVKKRPETIRKRKNRISQPGGGRKIRGIQNEHNVRLRRTRVPAALKPEPKFYKFKDQVADLYRLQLQSINHTSLLPSTNKNKYKLYYSKFST
jgi:hypothetical protein